MTIFIQFELIWQLFYGKHHNSQWYEMFYDNSTFKVSDQRPNHTLLCIPIPMWIIAAGSAAIKLLCFGIICLIWKFVEFFSVVSLQSRQLEKFINLRYNFKRLRERKCKQSPTTARGEHEMSGRITRVSQFVSMEHNFPSLENSGKFALLWLIVIMIHFAELRWIELRSKNFMRLAIRSIH